MANSKILVTGANGFVGSALCKRLQNDGLPFVAAVRRKHAFHQFEIGNLADRVDWSIALNGCDTVVHLAARVHVMNDQSKHPLTAFREINVAPTIDLARQAVRHGVRRFVFVSSIKVNGEMTQGTPFKALDVPAPQDAYGQSKLEAELALQEFSLETGVEVVIVRPPLVYGPGVGANFLRLMQLVRRGIPLPLGAIHNLRSMIALDNLVDLLIVCTKHPAAAGKTFLVSDNNDVSTPELVRMVAGAMGKRVFLLPAPPALLAASAALVGKSAAADRLLGSLRVDMAATQSILDWKPPVSMPDAINATVAHFLSHS